MDLRTRTSLLCAAFALAITVSILLRSRKAKVHLLLAAFAGSMSLWYFAQWLFRFFQAPIWYRSTAVIAVILPQLALHLFDAIVPRTQPSRSYLLRMSTTLGAVMLVLGVSNYQSTALVRGAIFLYVFGLVAAGLVSLATRGRRSTSRAVKERVRLLVIVGALALALSIGDFVWFIGAEIPPVGAVLSVVFLFALSESMRRERLIDLYEMIGRLVVSTALAFVLAGIFYVFVTYVGFETMYLNAVLASIAILLLFEPLRNKVEEKIHLIIFRQRHELETAVNNIQQRLVHVLEIDEMAETVVTALETSRRATTVALYLPDAEGDGMAFVRGFGLKPPERIEHATVRALLEQLERNVSVSLEDVARQADEARLVGGHSTKHEALLASSRVLGSLAASGLVIGIRSATGEVIGLLVLQDERVRDAFSSDEVALLEGLSAAISMVVENTRAYSRMKQRDRLAVLGQMAAGLAHEIKNPLGAIKGAAQFLADSGPDSSPLPASSTDFLNIIIEEVNRLDRVVGSVLDYARPNMGNPSPVDVNAVVRRTLQILNPASMESVELTFALDEQVPKVQIDAEQLRQVVMNLVHNAVQAMSGRGKLTVLTRKRDKPLVGWRQADGAGEGTAWVEVAVKDTGQGISPKILNNLFVPFFSTKTRGTGLGLAISQRIVQAAGGSIEVASQEGTGSTFTVVLPASKAEQTSQFALEDSSQTVCVAS